MSLTLINCGLTEISGLECVGGTLERLTLCDQHIERMENLALPNLRELLLQQNKITCIQGLNSCPRLHRLWIWGNQISKIEGLANCVQLRELWLQENKITRVEGLASLMHLENLGLAGNDITDFPDMSNSLSRLPCLSDLSLSDIHFGDNPRVTGLHGYRSSLVMSLKRLRVLDGVPVDDKQRQESEDTYLSHVYDFNEFPCP